ncbi:kinetoplastid kinetochore protein 2 [Trypanosoma equiperdum]|uniref:Serine/threonine-protein kinase PLK n=1 Tax=Trypanosoma equiperdum TaxID=5694 RepID=A0A1G4IJT5_TRYEQ|nr:kinetoplastid kinetochore protein 2 [Trypanosoma equiperdum]
MFNVSPASRDRVRSESQRTPRPRSSLSMPRELSYTPAISSIPSSLHTPFIQKCYVQGDNSTEGQQQQQQQPPDHMTVVFESDNMQLTTTSLLGKGGFGRVYVAQSSGGELCALKVSSKQMTDGDWERLRKEVALMSHFSQHPNVVKLIAAGRDRNFAYVAMECCASRSLHDIINKHGLEVPEILWVGYALIDTIAFLHAKGCIHRDLKPQNLLFDFDGNLKISDFGLSSNVTESEPRKTVAGTAMYMAPEIAGAVYKRMTNDNSSSSLRYGQEVDTWSIGVVLYVMLTRMNPYAQALENEGAHEMNKTQKTLTLFSAVAGAAWHWPAGWRGDKELSDVVNQILHRNPAQRATLQDILQHPVWDRRPLSCPLTLLQKLNLVERRPFTRTGAVGRSCSRAPEGMQPQYATKTAEVVLLEGLNQVIQVEESTRTQLVLESNEVINLIFGTLKLHASEANGRRFIVIDEKGCRKNIEDMLLTTRPVRCRSHELVSTAVCAKQPKRGTRVGSSLRPQRESSVLLAGPLAFGQTQDAGEIVRAASDRYAVVFSGRETSTRWSLRNVISLPRELNAAIEEVTCINKHQMKKLIKIPLGYVGFDCNVCDSAIDDISIEKPVFRCHKCDYDLCMNCAYEGKIKDVNFVCVSCMKKFASSSKLEAHSAKCRGPSMSPSARCSSRRNTMLWEQLENEGGSLLDIRLPTETKPRRSARTSCRTSGGRESSGGRISIGDSYVPGPEDLGTMVVAHRDANFPEMPKFSTQSDSKASSPFGEKEGADKNYRQSFSFELPPQVRLSKHRRDKGAEPRSSEELREIVEELTPTPKRVRTEARQNSCEPYAPQVNDAGLVVGIAARSRVEREGSLRGEQQSRNVVVIRADNAAKPQDLRKQSQVPRSASSSQPGSRMESQAIDTLSKPAPKNVAVREYRSASGQRDPLVPRTSLPSAQTGEIFGAPPLPRIVTSGRSSVPRSMSYTLPSAAGVARRQTSQPLVNLLGGVPVGAYGGGSFNPGERNASISNTNRTVGPGQGGTAYLALPRDKQNRDRFVDDFLSGAWVRVYSFIGSEVVVMYYSVQPGRYGALFPTEEGAATAVLDIHSKLVLYVPRMDKDTVTRTQCHPNVLSFFQDEIRILPATSAEKTLGGVLRGIMGFVSELTKCRGEGEKYAAAQSAYIHQREKGAVPAGTKFAYVRKAFPDPAGSFVLFRLSNLRSQVVFNNALLDIRWQSDKNHNVGQKYYVRPNGEAGPFTAEHSGILNHVNLVMRNVYRK